jgi:hypothetical protein
VFSKKNQITVSNAIIKKYGTYISRMNCWNLIWSGSVIGMLIDKFGGMRASLAVIIQPLKSEPVTIIMGKNVKGYDMN